METVHVRARTSPLGRLILDVPTSVADSDVDVTVTVQPRSETPRDHFGWPVGFWERFAGSMPDLPESDDAEAEGVEPIR